MNSSRGWCAEHAGHQAVQRSAIARNGAFKFKTFALRHDGHSVVANIATENDLVPRPGTIGRDVHAALDHANTRGGNKNLVALPAIHDLGVAGYEFHSGFRRGRPHRLHHPPQILYR